MGSALSEHEIERRLILRDCWVADKTGQPQESVDPTKFQKAVAKELRDKQLAVVSFGSSKGMIFSTMAIHGFTPKGRDVFCLNGELHPAYRIDV